MAVGEVDGVFAKVTEDDAGQALVTYVAAPGSPSEEALRLLASLAVT